MQLRARIFQTAESVLQLSSNSLTVGKNNYDWNGFHIESDTQLIATDLQGNKSYALAVVAASRSQSQQLASEINTKRGQVTRTWWG